MAQNTSHAVMAQRVEPHDSLDDFPTQPWATRALVEHVIRPFEGVFVHDTVWEPACNRGHMVRPLTEYFGRVYATDIHDYSADWDGQEAVTDFLFSGSEPADIASKGVDWIITNPPFRLAAQFVHRAIEIGPRGGVAMLARTTFLEGVNRYQTFFRPNPPSIVAQFTERVPMVKGRLTATGSTATAYCWLVWGTRNPDATRLVWIPPCRKALERDGDYED